MSPQGGRHTFVPTKTRKLSKWRNGRLDRIKVNIETSKLGRAYLTRPVVVSFSFTVEVNDQ